MSVETIAAILIIGTIIAAVMGICWFLSATDTDRPSKFDTAGTFIDPPLGGGGADGGGV